MVTLLPKKVTLFLNEIRGFLNLLPNGLKRVTNSVTLFPFVLLGISIFVTVLPIFSDIYIIYILHVNLYILKKPATSCILIS